jgi:hypothetical protein
MQQQAPSLVGSKVDLQECPILARNGYFYGRHRILRNCLGAVKKACREYRLVALRQICLSNGLATLPAKKRRAAEFSP